MNSHFNEIYYSLIILIWWVIAPIIIGTGFLIFFIKMVNASKKHKNFISDRKKNIKWGYRWDGTPYKKDFGWGNNYSKLNEDEYFIRLNAQDKEKVNRTDK